MIGKLLAHYEISALLGKGGMGEVYRALDQKLGRNVALKILPANVAADPERLARFEREAKTLAAVNHPGIATVFGLHEQDSTRFMAMELVPGTDLTHRISKRALPTRDALEFALQITEALEAAHQQGIIHRDLKPQNLMVTPDGRIKVLDFGLARLSSPGPLRAHNDPSPTMTAALTMPGTIMGTPAYMSPEQVQGEDVDARCDIWAFGALLYEMLTGETAFAGKTVPETMYKVTTKEPDLDLLPDSLPMEIRHLVRRCLVKEARNRLQAIGDARVILQEAIEGKLVPGESTSSPALTGDIGSPVECRMTITTEHVRQLSTRIPRMVGDSMTYLDNKRPSDVLIICLHGIGVDQREFEDVLRQTPYRAVSLSLYGFGPVARMRPALSYADHNLLVSFLVEEIHQKIAPKTLVMVGHSSGSDQCLQIVASPLGERLQLDGLVLLGPSAIPAEGRMSSPFARLTGDPDEIFSTLRAMSAYAENLTEWLIIHHYLLRAFDKFQTDTAALQKFAKTYIEALEDDRFFRLFQTAVRRTRHLRCVFGTDDTPESDHALELHIRDNALGDDFSEEMIANVPVGHTDLNNASVVLPLVEEIVRSES